MADTTVSTGLDIMNRYQSATTGVKDGEFDPTINRTQAQEEYDKKYKDKTTLDFNDMLSLMVAQFQNQTIDNQADTSDMMNQLVQMGSMQAMTELVSQMKEVTTANILNYSASLVDKYVTVGVYDEKNNLQEIYGKVEAAGTYDGQQVIFIEGKSYFLSSIMAIGKLPERVDKDETDGENTDNSVNAGSGTDGENTGDTTNTDNSVNAGSGADGDNTGNTGAEDDGAVG